jgi:hypothetical protein
MEKRTHCNGSVLPIQLVPKFGHSLSLHALYYLNFLEMHVARMLSSDIRIWCICQFVCVCVCVCAHVIEGGKLGGSFYIMKAHRSPSRHLCQVYIVHLAA